MNQRLCCIEAANGLVELVFTAAIEHDVSILLKESPGGARTDPGACACNDHDFACKSVHNSPLYVRGDVLNLVRELSKHAVWIHAYRLWREHLRKAPVFNDLLVFNPIQIDVRAGIILMRALCGDENKISPRGEPSLYRDSFPS